MPLVSFLRKLASNAIASLGPIVLCSSATWDPNGITVAGNGSSGRAGIQLSYPMDIGIDSQQNLIISDWGNYRLQKFFANGTIATAMAYLRVEKIFVDRSDNIYFTTVDDYVLRLTSTNWLSELAGDGSPGAWLNQFQQPLGLYVDQSGTIYVADSSNNRVMKWPVGATQGIAVAGGNGQGNAANQLDFPMCVFVDEVNEIGALYICDMYNNRIQKWLPGAVNGTTVIGGYTNLSQLVVIQPQALILDPTTRIMFILDSNNRIMKWLPSATQGIVIAGGIPASASNYYSTNQPNQLNNPQGMKFDSQWNLYVADYNNHRIQKFMFNQSSCVNYTGKNRHFILKKYHTVLT